MADVIASGSAPTATTDAAALTAGRTAARRRKEKIFTWIGIASTAFGLIALAFLIGDLLYHGLPRLSLDFFINFPSRRAAQAGILSAWVGSLLVIMVTALFGVVLGVSSGIYLEEYARKNWVTNTIEINVNNLAGVPSIVFGLLALGLFVYGFGFGRSVLTAGLTLALLILPIIIVATREAIRAVPQAIREAAYGVGATKWQVTKDHVLPSAIPGVLTGVIIGISRALGETAPLITIGALTFIAFLPTSPIKGEFPFLSFEWLFDGFTVLPIQAFNWISRPGDDFHANAAAAGLVLLAITLSMNAVAIVIRYRLRKKLQW